MISVFYSGHVLYLLMKHVILALKCHIDIKVRIHTSNICYGNFYSCIDVINWIILFYSNIWNHFWGLFSSATDFIFKKQKLLNVKENSVYTTAESLDFSGQSGTLIGWLHLGRFTKSLSHLDIAAFLVHSLLFRASGLTNYF